LARLVPHEPNNPLAIAARKRILDNWEDYVRPGLKVVSKGGTDDATTVTLRVVVMSDFLKREAARLRTELDPSRKPRVIVVIRPVFDDGPADAARAAEVAITEAFTSRGFRLVPEVKPEVREEIISAMRSDDTQTLARVARASGAEIALVGAAARTRERKGEVYGRKVAIYTPVVKLKAIDTASARTIFSSEHSGEESAGEAALPNAANALAETCIKEVLKDRYRVAPAFATVAVRIDGISFENFAVFIRQARAVPGVASVRAKPFAGESGEVEINHARDPVDLARELVRLEGLSLRLLSAGAEAIRIKSTEKP
jgi:hypothetical protein